MQQNQPQGDFQPFSLGNVLMTGEAIKARREQTITERLQQQYLGEQLNGLRAENAEKDRLRQVGIGKEKALEIAIRTAQISRSQNPRAYIEQNEPDLIANLTQNGVDWNTLDDVGLKDKLTAMQNLAYQELGVAPLETQQIGGATVITQGGQYKNSINPRPATDNTPMSYREHVLAQTDPEFRKFLESRKGRGLSVTLPDGTTVEMGGDGSRVGPSELSKPTINNLQETIIKSSDRLDRLNQTLSTYNPDFLRAKGLLKAGSTKLLDFAGVDVSPEQRQFLSQYAEFRSNAATDFNQTLKDLSGAAVTGNEYERAKQSAPSATDISPTEFEAKARATTKFVTRAIMRANWALKNGIGVQSIDELAKRMPLEGIDGVYNARANEIWQQMGGTPETRQQAIDAANQEFGIAR